jgi:hypothetical protein
MYEFINYNPERDYEKLLACIQCEKAGMAKAELCPDVMGLLDRDNIYYEYRNTMDVIKFEKF